MEYSIGTQPDSLAADATRLAFLENECIPRLLGLRNADGGWSFSEGGASRVEPTAWAVHALRVALRNAASRNSDAEKAHTAGEKFLLGTQLADGSWASAPGQSRGTWVTSLACWALSAGSGQTDCVEKGLGWLLAERPRESSFWWKLKRRFAGGANSAKQDDSFYGWSWTAGTASWVEPTAYACLALRSGSAKSISMAGDRLRTAEKMLYDRECAGGGWNSGNPATYGTVGSPEFGPTVWALLALRGNGERTEVQETLAWIEQNWARVNTPTALSLTAISLRAYGKTNEAVLGLLQKCWAEEEILWDVPVIAWTALAISGDLAWLPKVEAGEVR